MFTEDAALHCLPASQERMVPRLHDDTTHLASPSRHLLDVYSGSPMVLSVGMEPPEAGAWSPVSLVEEPSTVTTFRESMAGGGASLRERFRRKCDLDSLLSRKYWSLVS